MCLTISQVNQQQWDDASFCMLTIFLNFSLGSFIFSLTYLKLTYIVTFIRLLTLLGRGAHCDWDAVWFHDFWCDIMLIFSVYRMKCFYFLCQSKYALTGFKLSPFVSLKYEPLSPISQTRTEFPLKCQYNIKQTKDECEEKLSIRGILFDPIPNSQNTSNKNYTADSK